MSKVKIVIFDVNQTIFKLDEIEKRFKRFNLSSYLVENWFLSVLKEGFALSDKSKFVDFKTIGLNELQKILFSEEIKVEKKTINYLFDGFKNLKAHPEIKNAFQILKKKNIKIVTLTNGSAKNTENLLKKNLLEKYVTKCFSIDSVKKWKPHPEPYEMVIKHFNCTPQDAIMIAVHGWDLNGAKQIGLKTGFINRYEFWMNDYFQKPDYEAKDASLLVKKIFKISIST